jgi:hypothetical protein
MKSSPSPCAGSNFVLAADRVASYGIHDILVIENTEKEIIYHYPALCIHQLMEVYGDVR